MVSLKVQFGSDVIEVTDAANEDQLARIVNKTLRKFYANTKYVVDVKEPF